ncbi:MAG: sulfatase [Acidobacteriota bacterium]
MASTVAGGFAAGLAAFGLDLGLARLTLGHALPLAWRDPAVYVAVGLVLALGAQAVPALRRLPTVSRMLGTGSAAFAALFVLPVAERLEHAVRPVAGATVGGLAAALGVVGCVGGGWLLSRLARRPGSWGWTVGCLLFGLLVALGLAVNRELVERPLEPKALVADAVLVLAAGLAALAVGRRRLALGAASGFLVVGLFAVLLRAGHAVPPPRATSSAGERPHLVLVIIDTLRADVFERVLAETPEGRALAERIGGAAYFTQATAAAPWTAPSVGSILTGLYPREHGFGTSADDPSRPLRSLSPSVPTLAGRLRNRGYHTEAIVTNPLLHPVSGIARGFEHYESLGGTTTKLPLLSVLAERLQLLADEPYQPARQVRRRLESRLDALTASDRPVFLWLHLMDPHLPLHEHPRLPAMTLDPSAGHQARLYVDEVRAAAAELTAMLDGLDRVGLWRDSLFVLVSDHGEMMVEDSRSTGVIDPETDAEKVTGHGHALYDELVRVPLVIRPPGGLPSTRRVSALVSHVDLHDTIVDLLGVDVPRIGRDRISAARWLGGGIGGGADDARRIEALLGGIQVGEAQHGLRTATAKLIVRPKTGDAELYDLQSDPGEIDELSDSEAPRRRLLQLRLERALEALDSGPETALLEVDAETRRRLEALGYVQ